MAKTEGKLCKTCENGILSSKIQKSGRWIRSEKDEIPISENVALF